MGRVLGSLSAAPQSDALPLKGRLPSRAASRLLDLSWPWSAERSGFKGLGCCFLKRAVQRAAATALRAGCRSPASCFVDLYVLLLLLWLLECGQGRWSASRVRGCAVPSPFFQGRILPSSLTARVAEVWPQALERHRGLGEGLLVVVFGMGNLQGPWGAISAGNGLGRAGAGVERFAPLYGALYGPGLASFPVFAKFVSK